MFVMRSKIKVKSASSKFFSSLSDRLLWAIFYFFKFLGLAPLTVCKFENSKTVFDLRNDQTLTFSKSKFSLFYNIVLMVIIFIASYLVFPLIKEASMNKDYALGHSFRSVKVTMAISVMLIIWCSTTSSHKEAIRILSQLTRADSQLELFSDVYHLQSSKGSIILFFSLNVLVWIGLCVLEFVVHDNFHIWVCIVLPNLIINWYLTQYALILIMIEKRIKSINSAFIMLSTSRMEPIYFEANGEMTNSKKTIRDNFYGITQGYSFYSKICRDISDYYSVPVLFSIIFSLGAIVYCGYYVIQPIFPVHSNHSVISIFCWIFWMFMHSSPIFFLTWSVTRVIKEVRFFTNLSANISINFFVILICYIELFFCRRLK